MTIPKRTQAPGTYFVTTACWQRRRLFQVTRNADLFLSVLEHYREHYLLHGFVIMPDHLHLMLSPIDITLERAMQLIKGGSSFRYAKEIGPKMEVWQKGFTDHRVRNADEYRTRMNYMFQNPVRARLVAEGAIYPYSSASGKMANGFY